MAYGLRDGLGHCYNLEKNSEDRILVEAKTFQQTRERTYLPWSSESRPCRMKMKEAGWFVVCNIAGELVTVCLYCKIVCKGWTNQHDPYEIHKRFSSDCIFVLYSHRIQTPSSPIIESVARRDEVRPSSHNMAQVFKRTKSFEQWPPGSPHPLPNVLAEAGLFYNGQNTIVECFFCHGQRSIFRSDDDPMLVHINSCEYAKHLKNYSDRTPLDIQPSKKKIYELNVESINNIKFYFLRCINALTPGILLSALTCHTNEQELQFPDMILKRLRPKKQLQVNSVTSSDGPLFKILQSLANDSNNLKTLSNDQQCSIDTKNDSGFQCKTCFTINASPHVVSIRCCHIGLCSEKCFSKWMTCVICGYTLGKGIRIFCP